MIMTIICTLMYVVAGFVTVSGIVRMNGYDGIKGMIEVFTDRFGIKVGTIVPLILVILWPLVVVFFMITFIGGLIYGYITTIFRK